MQIHVLRFSIPLPVTAQLYDKRTLLLANLTAWTHSTIGALTLSLRVTASLTYSVVQEFQPVVHHLRRSAST